MIHDTIQTGSINYSSLFFHDKTKYGPIRETGKGRGFSLPPSLGLVHFPSMNELHTQRTTNKCKQFIEPFGQKHILSLRKIVDLFHQHNVSVLADTCFQMHVEKDKKQNKNCPTKKRAATLWVYLQQTFKTTSSHQLKQQHKSCQSAANRVPTRHLSNALSL